MKALMSNKHYTKKNSEGRPKKIEIQDSEIRPRYSTHAVFLFFFSVLFAAGGIFLLFVPEVGQAIEWKTLLISSFCILMGSLYTFFWYFSAYRVIELRNNTFVFRHLFGFCHEYGYDEILNINKSAIKTVKKNFLLSCYRNNELIADELRRRVKNKANRMMIRETENLNNKLAMAGYLLIPYIIISCTICIPIGIKFKLNSIGTLSIMLIPLIPAIIIESTIRRNIMKTFEDDAIEEIRDSFKKKD